MIQVFTRGKQVPFSVGIASQRINLNPDRFWAGMLPEKDVMDIFRTAGAYI